MLGVTLALDLKDLDSTVPTLLSLVDHQAGISHLREVVVLHSLVHQIDAFINKSNLKKENSFGSRFREGYNPPW